MAVTITNQTPGDNSIQLGWNSNPAANTDANAYVATDPADFNTPNCISVPADQSGLLPGVTDFTATVTGLTSGTSYFVMCEADGVDSAVANVQTTGNPPGPTPTVHLIPKGDDDGDGPEWDAHPGEIVIVKIRVTSLSNPSVRVSGITVNFAITGGTGTGKLKKTSAVSNMRGIARVPFVCAKKGDVSVTASATLADAPAIATVNIL
jgi:hypothetical protein